MKKHGFTLIELLVVIGIIGILSTLVIVALTNARVQSRDAKRVADIKQVQTALQLYFNDKNNYPVVGADGLVLGVSGATTLSSGAGFSDTPSHEIYISPVPQDPTSGWFYLYSGTTGADYAITFSLEGRAGGLAPGSHRATAGGIE